MQIFDGQVFAEHKRVALQASLRRSGVHPVVIAVLFREDQGSRLYTGLKKTTADQLGIEYRVVEFSLRDDPQLVADQIVKVSAQPEVTGVIVQKPWRKTWEEVVGLPVNQFSGWWTKLVEAIDPIKDVDGLHPSTHQAIEAGTWVQQGRVLPATCQAVWDILRVSGYIRADLKYTILGRSDLLGRPLFQVLHHQGFQVELLGKAELAERLVSGQKLRTADVLISATGQKGIVTGDLIKSGVAIVDVGEPRPDVDRASVGETPAFLTPVPGGVGPVTVMCLMENAVELADFMR